MYRACGETLLGRSRVSIPNEVLPVERLAYTRLYSYRPRASFSNTLDANLTNAVAMPNGDSMVVWVLNNPIWTDYADPTLGYVMRGDTNYPKLFNTIDASSEGSWNYWLIVNDPTAFPIPHPIHLHGHDFFVIGNGAGLFDEATANLNWQNPTRRDTTSLPAAGWLAIAYRSDNPGTWLMHCHIAFHIAEGFGMQFIEAPDNTTLPDENTFNQTCSNWKAYQTTELYQSEDSGL
jgi:FtsP/CotA-like multicopper oxidase with cupredoxin domain